MAAHKTWLEVALNGGWTRQIQPLIPVAVSEIVAQGIACVRAGAAIVHLHAYDAGTGRQKDDPAIYAEIIAGIRTEVDAIVYPTIPHLEGAGLAPAERARRRYGAIAALAERGLLEWAVVDPGTVNLVSYDAIAGDRPGFVYLNPESDIRAGLELAARHRFHPSYAIYEPGFLRLGAALHRRYP
jgi:3-keto-5-aminohexanoate cleavage enzyme